MQCDPSEQVKCALLAEQPDANSPHNRAPLKKMQEVEFVRVHRLRPEVKSER
ncbi:hypothetical protein CYFUS_002486 [Cystobacter fuscus]|uniref:Uncharacterized protein n=1 Tax=Cystobacter fuscus TaxID=43 RepID=A0A250IZA9_9BACT|nr:hypothetical protein CYFUS_002486 [Cystobacter fuscus]